MKNSEDLKFPFYRRSEESYENGETNTVYKFTSPNTYERIKFMEFKTLPLKTYHYEKIHDAEVHSFLQEYRDRMIHVNEKTWNDAVQDFLTWCPS